jgi:hypothetical protein
MYSHKELVIKCVSETTFARGQGFVELAFSFPKFWTPNGEPRASTLRNNIEIRISNHFPCSYTNKKRLQDKTLKHKKETKKFKIAGCAPSGDIF